jgi:hypothetical protein
MPPASEDWLTQHNARMNALALEEWEKRATSMTTTTQIPEKPMPNIDQMLDSKFIAKSDCEPAKIVTIRAVVQELDKERDKIYWMMYFNELKKGLKLNNTIIKTLGAGFGAQSESWLGRRVKLYVDPTVQFAGQMIGGIRIMLPSANRQIPGASAALAGPTVSNPNIQPIYQPPLQPPAAAPPAAVSDEFDDDIPF